MKGYLINCKSSSLISFVVYVLCKYGTHVYINVSSLLDRKILVGENLGKLWVISQNFLTNIHRYTENVFGLCTDCSSLAKFLSPVAFTFMVHQNFSPPNISYVRYPNIIRLCSWVCLVRMVWLLRRCLDTCYKSTMT